MPCSRSTRWNSSLRWHIPADRVLEPSLVFHAHSVLDMLSLQLVVRGLLLGVVLDSLLQPLLLSLCGPAFEMILPILPMDSILVVPAWIIREVCVAVDLSLVLELR